MNSDGLSRLVIEGYTRATLDAMSKAMISIQDTGHPTGLMTAADDLECFYKNLQVLRLGVDGMEDRPIGQGSQIGSDTQTRREVLNSAIATNLDTFAREATDICLEAYSHRDGPKIARKRDTRTTTDWESFIQLTTILKGPARTCFAASRDIEIGQKGLTWNSAQSETLRASDGHVRSNRR